MEIRANKPIYKSKRSLFLRVLFIINLIALYVLPICLLNNKQVYKSVINIANKQDYSHKEVLYNILSYNTKEIKESSLNNDLDECNEIIMNNNELLLVKNNGEIEYKNKLFLYENDDSISITSVKLFLITNIVKEDGQLLPVHSLIVTLKNVYKYILLACLCICLVLANIIVLLLKINASSISLIQFYM